MAADASPIARSIPIRNSRARAFVRALILLPSESRSRRRALGAVIQGLGSSPGYRLLVTLAEEPPGCAKPFPTICAVIESWRPGGKRACPR